MGLSRRRRRSYRCAPIDFTMLYTYSLNPTLPRGFRRRAGRDRGQRGVHGEAGARREGRARAEGCKRHGERQERRPRRAGAQQPTTAGILLMSSPGRSAATSARISTPTTSSSTISSSARGRRRPRRRPYRRSGVLRTRGRLLRVYVSACYASVTFVLNA